MDISHNMVPFDNGVFTTRCKMKHISCNDIINHPSISFNKTQLVYFKQKGFIPKEYNDQIEEALQDSNFTGYKDYRGTKYIGSMIEFGPSKRNELKERCKKLNTSISNIASLEHISLQTIARYKKERQIPSDLLEKLNRRLSMMEKEGNNKPSEETVIENEPANKVDTDSTVSLNIKELESKPETKQVPHISVIENKMSNNSLEKVVQSLKKVVHCNGEANLNLDNISERYECDLETFVNSVFSLISENYVVYTTYSNGKRIFTLGEPM